MLWILGYGWTMVSRWSCRPAASSRSTQSWRTFLVDGVVVHSAFVHNFAEGFPIGTVGLSAGDELQGLDTDSGGDEGVVKVASTV